MRANGGHDGARARADGNGRSPRRARPTRSVRKMRASVLVWRTLVGAHGRDEVSLPGGLIERTRPSDLHLPGLRQPGPRSSDEGYVIARAPKGLTGSRIVFTKASCGRDENLMRRRSLPAARRSSSWREPEINDLAICLQNMGADIQGLGTDRLRIRGVDRLKGTSHRRWAGPIEAGPMPWRRRSTMARSSCRRAPGTRGRGRRTLRSAVVAITGPIVASRCSVPWRAAGRRCQERDLSAGIRHEGRRR